MPLPGDERSIVLIGPTASGKSSAGRILAERLGWAFVDLDDLRDTYYPEFGIDLEAERSAYEQGGMAGVIAYWKPFELRSVERVMREHPTRTVVAFGGGQSVYTDEADIRRAQQALRGASRVMMLVPDADLDAAVEMLVRRIAEDPSAPMGMEASAFLDQFQSILIVQLASESTRRLATDVMVTGMMSPDEIASAIQRLLYDEFTGEPSPRR